MAAGVKPTRIDLEGWALPDTVSIDAVYTGDDADWDLAPGEGGQDQWKQPVRCATTAAVTIATALNAGDTIDGVTLAAGDRVLVKDQGGGIENGIYVAGTTPARAADMDEDEEVLGAVVYVIDGTDNAGTGWAVTNDAATIVDTDAINWAAFGGGGGIPETLIDAAGDLIVGSAADTAARLAVGATDGHVLTVDAGEALGVKWAAAPGAGSGDTTGQIILGWDGGGAVITAKYAEAVAPYTGTITGWTLLADQSGSVSLDVWADTYANYPPTVLDTIVAAAPPTLSSQTKNASTTLTGWTTAITAGQAIRATPSGISTITRLLLVIDYSRP